MSSTSGTRGRAADRLPPGPGAPGPVQTLQWLLRPIPFMERCRRRYGAVFSLRLGPARNVVMVANPEMAKEVLTGDPEVFRAGDTNGLFRPVVGSDSILVLDGEKHMRHRRLLLPAFKGEHVRQYGDYIATAARRRISRWPRGKPFALQPEMEAISFEAIMRIGFGEGLDERHERLRSAVPEMMDRCASPVLMLPWFRQDLLGLGPAARTKRVLREIDEILFDLVAERRADPLSQLRTDVLSMLVATRDEAGGALSDREIRDELLTLLMAGYETTTSALTWALERILRIPAVSERLLDEIDRGEDRYLDAVVKEVLRCRTVVPVVARRLREQVRLGGYSFPAGTILMVAIYLIHRDPDVFSEPERFRPERFLGDREESRHWIPFGGGVRRCLGASFAQHETKIVLRTVLSEVALSPEGEAPEHSARRRFTFAPHRGGRVIVTEAHDEPEEAGGGERAGRSRRAAVRGR